MTSPADPNAESDAKTPIERLLAPIHAFLHGRLTGAALLLGATVVALAWANGPWEDSHRAILETVLTVKLGEFGLSKPLLLWINDGLIGVFFFVVGLEIKREILVGELSTARKALLPIAAAVGGMVVPAALYLSVNPEGVARGGWGIPVATDIAFALGVLALLGDRVPVGLKVFLVALAIVDDIGAILVIAIFYTENVSFLTLGLGALLVLLAAAANAAGVRNAVVYFVLGAIAWFAFLESGVHATLAAVLMAFVIPARTRLDGPRFRARIQGLPAALQVDGEPARQRLLTREEQTVLQRMEAAVEDATAPLQTLEHALLPLVTLVVLPTFALANAGVRLSGDIAEAYRHPAGLGIILGLCIGKPVGIFAAAWIAVKLRAADLPSGVRWSQVAGVGMLGGIGFTMSLFVSSLAFTDPAITEVAKIGILSASAVSAIAGWSVLRLLAPRPESGAR